MKLGDVIHSTSEDILASYSLIYVDDVDVCSVWMHLDDTEDVSHRASCCKQQMIFLLIDMLDHIVFIRALPITGALSRARASTTPTFFYFAH